jgi:hypothetical protein
VIHQVPEQVAAAPGDADPRVRGLVDLDVDSQDAVPDSDVVSELVAVQTYGNGFFLLYLV